MKKILLLVVSGLFIVCMAGSAMASASLDLGTREVDLSDNVPVTVRLSATASPYYKMVLTTPDGVTGYIVPDSGSQIPSLTPVTGASAEKTFGITSGQANVYHTGKLYLTGNKAGQVSVAVYEGTSTTPSATWSLRAYSTVDTQIPEFPTVALPIAALIGIVFIFGHKKDRL